MGIISKFYQWNTAMICGSKTVDQRKLSESLLISKDWNIIGNKLKLRLDEKYSKRITNRDFLKNVNCSFEQMEYIFSNSFATFREGNRLRRPYPSAGALYPIDIYVIINHVADIKKGIYKYNSLQNSLIFIKEIEDFEKISYIFLNQSFTKENKFSFACLFIEDSFRIEAKYGDRGYRYALIECGHIAENVYLTSREKGLKAVAVGGFIDMEINLLLELDLEYFPLYAVFVGN